jgi:chemotaxis protein MotA
MDIGTLSGVLLAIAMMGGALVMMAGHGGGGEHGHGGGGVNLAAFVDIPALMLVVGGSFAVALVGFPLKTALNAFRLLLKVFLNKRPHPKHLIEKLVKLAEVARRDGLLALERQIPDLDDKFMARAISMAVDGMQPEVIQGVLNKEIEGMAARHLEGKKMIELVGRCGPAFGMIATLIGLVLMLGNLSDPDSIGPSMAVALVGTMYGALAANLVAIPFSEKLAGLSHEEALCREVIVDGVLSIQSGDSPRVIQERLNAYLSPGEREEQGKHE